METTTTQVLCDTGTISRYLTNKPEELEKITEINEESGFCISIVSRIELFNWLGLYRGLDKSERAVLLRSIKNIQVIHLNENISKLATEFSNRDMVAKPADLLIGATARYHNMRLYTLNKKDFVKFGLTLA